MNRKQKALQRRLERLPDIPHISDEDMQRLVHHRQILRDCQRRHRERARNGARCLRIVISDADRTLDAFVRVGVLAQERRHEDKAVENAVAELCRAGFRAIEAREGNERAKENNILPCPD
ncbi:hypothetical protein ACVWXP_006441 [Bradyrhizobium sp. USDA 4463]